MLCLLSTTAVTICLPYSHNMFELSVCMAAYGAFVGLSGPIAAYVTDVSPQHKLE